MRRLKMIGGVIAQIGKWFFERPISETYDSLRISV